MLSLTTPRTHFGAITKAYTVTSYGAPPSAVAKITNLLGSQRTSNSNVSLVGQAAVIKAEAPKDIAGEGTTPELAAQLIAQHQGPTVTLLANTTANTLPTDLPPFASIHLTA